MRKPSAALVISCISLFVALSGVGIAADGGNFILGHSNSAASTSILTSGVNGRTLQLSNSSSGNVATALGLFVKSGRPPFTVNSATRVTNLNASLLGGRHASDLVRTANGLQASSISTSGTASNVAAKVTINAPGPGYVLVTSNIQETLNAGAPAYARAWLHDETATTDTSEMVTNVETNYAPITFAPTYVFPVSSAGSRTFDLMFRAGRNDVTLVGSNGMISALYVPFDGSGM
jgi:hypothetical protein